MTLEKSPDAGWIQLFSGRAMWPLNPNPDHICIRDIAHALSMKCRFAGHVNSYYSVAQHSVMVSLVVPQEHAMWGLLHDGSEAYLPDLPRPVKRMIPAFKEAEDKILRAVATAFDLEWPMPECIHAADMTLLATERRDLMSAPPYQWIEVEQVAPLPSRIEPMNPDQAEEYFLERYRELS